MQGFDFDLTNALAGQADLVAHFFKRQRLFTIEAKAKAQNRRFALIDHVQKLLNGFQIVVVEYLIFRRWRLGIGEQFSEGDPFAVSAR